VKRCISLGLCLLLIAAVASSVGGQEVRFADVSKEAGLVMRPRSKHPNKDIALSRKGFEDVYAPGYFWNIRDVAFADADGDGNLDIYLLNQTLGSWCRLWLGDGKGGFTEMKSDQFLVTWQDEKLRPNPIPKAASILPFDFRGNGAQDILLSTSDQHGYRFRCLPTPAGKEGPSTLKVFGTHHWTDGTTVLLSDVDGDGCVDFFLGGQRYRRSAALMCGTFPAYEQSAARGEEASQGRSRLRFEVDLEQTALFLPIGAGSIAADFDGDGRVDLLCRGAGVQLLRNLGNRRFEDVTEQAGLAKLPAGGPIAVADFNNDGLLDIFCGMRLYLNQGGGKFKDATADSGLGSVGTGGNATVADFDNDGLPDLLVCESKTARLYRNLGGGKFRDVSKESGLGEALQSDSPSAAGDFDNDGRVDVLVVTADRGPGLFRNTTAGGNHWLKVKLRGPRGNREAAGAQVTVYAAGKLGDRKAILGYQERIVATEFRTPCPLHFGLGANQKCDVRVVFPGGQTVERKGVASDATVTVEAGNESGTR
jgi:hypothetical protein